MKILCVTDQQAGSCHSSIDGVFNGPLRERCDIYTVFFSRELKEAQFDGNRLNIPYRYKRRGAARYIDQHLRLDSFDVVIVRNFFPVLRSFLKEKGGRRFRLGFWNSFPHTYRRYFQAIHERKGVLRKRTEYAIRDFFEKRMVRNCDFLMIMSEEFKRLFFQDVDIPYLCLPMGYSASDLPELELTENPVKKLIYTGAIDKLLETDLLVEAMSELTEPFQLDIYTASDNAAVERIRRIAGRDSRIKVLPALPRRELFRKMAGYDVGIGMKPENAVYNVSSPTKTVEYYAIGLPALVNYLPEYRLLFDDSSAFFCDFTPEGVREGVRRILRTDKKSLVAMGTKGRQTIEEARNYRTLSEQVFNFLQRLPSDATAAQSMTK